MTSPLKPAKERLGIGVFLYVRECFVCIELKNSDNKAECLWMSIKGRLVRQISCWESCSRPPKQHEEVDELCCEWLADVSSLPALVLVGDSKLLDTYWKLNTVERKQAGRFLEYVEKNFLFQLVRTAVAFYG